MRTIFIITTLLISQLAFAQSKESETDSLSSNPNYNEELAKKLEKEKTGISDA